MEIIIESISWVMLGFVPTLCAMGLAWKIMEKKRNKLYGLKVEMR
jgi:hypothetical protein